MPNNLAWVNSTVPNLERYGHKRYNEIFFLSPLLSFLSSSFFFSRLVSLFSITFSFLSLSPLTHLSLSLSASPLDHFI